MFDEIKGLPEKFAKEFGQAQAQIIARSCNFVIKRASDGRLEYSVNGANPELVYKGFVGIDKVIKSEGLK